MKVKHFSYPANSGHFVSSEGELCRCKVESVDVSGACLQCIHHSVRPRQVPGQEYTLERQKHGLHSLCEDPASEAKVGVIGSLNHLLLLVKEHQRGGVAVVG